MSIIVVCPGCRKSFNVSDRFAGQSGACPKCKHPIKVPKKEEEVKVHSPEEFADGGRSTTGQLLTKPIAKKRVQFQPVVAVAIGGGTLVVLLLTWAAGSLIAGNIVVRAVGLLLVSVPLVIGAYWFLRNDDLEPYHGTALYVRAGICAAAYVILWFVYGHVSGTGMMQGEIWQWLFVAPPILITGALAALGCFDLDFGDGLLHYAFYVVVTILLRAVAGMGWIWEAAAG